MSVHHLRLLVLITCAAIILAPAPAAARGATPVSAGSHDVEIFEGTCADLSSLRPRQPDTLPSTSTIATPEGGHSGAVTMSTATLDEPTGRLALGEHAITVRESTGNHLSGVACGDIDGSLFPPNDGTSIAIGLYQTDSAGLSGIAILQDTDDHTTVTIYLAEGLEGSASPVAKRDVATAPADIVQIDIRNFTYTPPAIIVAAGQRVTWTNNDPVAHTVVPRDRNAFRPGTLQAGETLSRTFDKPGVYEYFCEFHANMRGVVVVV